VSIITSIIGCSFVKTSEGGKIMHALYRGVIIAGVLSLIAFWFVTQWLMADVAQASAGALTPLRLWLAAAIGIVLTGTLMWITEYYTGTQYQSGPLCRAGINHRPRHQHHRGIAVSMKACALPVLAVSAAILASFWIAGGNAGNVNAGLYGIAISATAMLSMTGIIVALDALWSDHRQRRRYRRNGRNAEGRAQHYRSARRGRQYDQGRYQGLCHRLRGPWPRLCSSPTTRPS